MIERILVASFRIAVVIKLALFALFVVTLTQAVAAQCTASNLLDEIARDHPAALARIDARARAIPNGTGKFYRVEKDGAVSHLYGTMHVSDPRATKMAPDVLAALDGARTVALEVKEVLDPSAMRKAAMSNLSASMYMDGSTVESRLDAPALNLVRTRVAARGGMPWFAAKRLRPWVLMAAIAIPACEEARKKSGVAILDEVIAARAKEADASIVGLETVGSQLKAMASLPEPMMVAALSDVARLGTRMNDVFETTVALYETGQTARMWALVRDPVLRSGLGEGKAKSLTGQAAAYAAFQAGIVDARNVTMVEGAVPLLEKGRAFVAVGALHLPGEKGIVELLRARGFTVTVLDG